MDGTVNDDSDDMTLYQSFNKKISNMFPVSVKHP